MRFCSNGVYLFILSLALNLAFAGPIHAKTTSEVKLKGKLEAYVSDGLDGGHKLSVYLKEEKTQRRYELLSDKVPHAGMLNAKSVVVTGKQKQSSQIEVMNVAYDDSTLSSTQISSNYSGATGVQKTLVYLVNFQDKPLDKPWTLEQVQDLVFNQVNSFILENSSNRTSVAGTVVGWYTLAMDSTSCDGFAIERLSKQMASNAGIVVSNYDRHILVFPANTACGYSGMAQTGSLVSTAWIHNSMTLRTIAHELSHNLGVLHSSALKCTGAPLLSLVTDCSHQEYGNTLDIMGYSGTIGHLNSFQKERLGWFSVGEINEVTADGVYSISPAEFAGTQARALKVYRGLNTAGDHEWFYIEYRQQIGFDAMIINRSVVNASNAFNGVTIVLGTQENGKNLLLDMTAGSEFVDMKDPALLTGAKFTDPATGLTVETISINSSAASVRITGVGSGPAPIDSTAPVASISSPSAGSSVSGNITVAASATDNVGVSKVEFYIDGSLKGSDTSAPYSLAINTTNYTNGNHNVMAKAYDANGNVGSSASVSFSINNIVADTTPPSVTITSPANGMVYSPRTSLNLQASASDNVGVTRVEFLVNGTLICTDYAVSYSCPYKLSAAKGVSYVIEARAYDAAGNTSKYQISIMSAGGTTAAASRK
ncbi:Ig-like domain-containing protein [Bdellovibrio sp. HCB337]|uniref:Ig-like domain-containing protein n=1 Tax=Bdellovibrio sp. HCB337 TaxID=3394358 RepID=UPI0039A5E358